MEVVGLLQVVDSQMSWSDTLLLKGVDMDSARVECPERKAGKGTLESREHILTKSTNQWDNLCGNTALPKVVVA